MIQNRPDQTITVYSDAPKSYYFKTSVAFKTGSTTYLVSGDYEDSIGKYVMSAFGLARSFKAIAGVVSAAVGPGSVSIVIESDEQYESIRTSVIDKLLALLSWSRCKLEDKTALRGTMSVDEFIITVTRRLADYVDLSPGDVASAARDGLYPFGFHSMRSLGREHDQRYRQFVQEQFGPLIGDLRIDTRDLSVHWDGRARESNRYNRPIEQFGHSFNPETDRLNLFDDHFGENQRPHFQIGQVKADGQSSFLANMSGSDD